jgi:parallel beta-helix repeat protein
MPINPFRPLSTRTILLAIAVAWFPGFAGQGQPVSVSDTVFTSNIDIPPGVTWNIVPGSKIQFDGYYGITVRGLLVAEGTAAKPISFSSVARPETLREDPAWKGIEILGKKANARFKHCSFSGAYRNLVWESSPSFDSCDFTGNHYGLYCSKKSSPLVSNCRIHHNTYGIAVDYSFPLLLNNAITGNVIGLYLQLTAESIAGKNLIASNETNIRVEKAYGNDSASFHMQSLWKVMQQLY